MSFLTFPQHALKPTAILACGLAFTMAASEPSLSRRADLGGSWSGAGTVTLPSGETERARCRARFSPQGGGSYGMNAVCATPSYRAEQTAVLERVGSDRYAGSFYNPEYSYSGVISVTVRGNRLSATISGGEFAGRMSLRRG